jgi:hypothetical protein
LSSPEVKNDAVVSRLIAQGKIEVVEPGRAESTRQLEEALAHLKSADVIIENDAAGAFQLTYDAVRKALQAVLLASGLRVSSPPRGNHYVFIELAESGILIDPAWATLRWMRELRNKTEYPVLGQLTAQIEDAKQALVAAEAMTKEAARLVNYEI